MLNNIKDDLQLFDELVTLFLEDENQNPVAEYINPKDVNKVLDITLQESAISKVEYKKILKKLLLKSTKSSSKLFFNQLFGGRHSKAVLGDLLAVILNNSMATYKIAGPQISIEKEILSKIYSLIGYNNKAGGTFPTGGSMSNFMSLVMARDKVNTISNKSNKKRLIAYSSENSHYSISKNASFSGIGKENVRYIKSDQYGRICKDDFENQINNDISNGFLPFYLNATAGTTVLCAFDNIEELVPICRKHEIWIHLDGAFGGAVIFSEKYKYLVKGINFTDSFCFNAHKTLGAPISTSLLVVKDKNDLYNSFNNSASYLYQTHDSDFNLGQTSFECGRRNNALKLWTMWKAIGSKGIAKIINHEFKLANFARNYVINNSNYKIYSFENSLSICFNYKNFDPEDLCTQLYENNLLMVGFGHFHANKFIRLVTVNSENSTNNLSNFFQILEEYCERNEANIKKV
ncbi:aminotransferase class V-fold PLP-dependent enzyme [Flavobacteriales bacterium]|jgi:sulfinoalanine decarboxylase/sulfinoalanine decarboxylase/aspartate 1-decarboxylase|nr:aminotransferase class V-fold PLP-dependent enzyme [Flavobacteriales bacterium]MDC1069101.1 aminotransferase class V-fold PLP-dependent enzyme [Flavobacteriales bacterium]